MEKRLPRDEGAREDIRKDIKIDRHAYKMQQTDPFYIAPEDIPPGVNLKYVRVEYTIEGSEIDSNNLRKHAQAFWVPVSPSEFPKINGQDYLRPDHPFKKNVYNNGHILMKRPMEYLEMDLEIYQEKNDSVIHGLKGMGGFDHDDRMPYVALEDGRRPQIIKNTGHVFSDW